jgi:hypothetical protein
MSQQVIARFKTGCAYDFYIIPVQEPDGANGGVTSFPDFFVQTYHRGLVGFIFNYKRNKNLNYLWYSGD